MRSTSCTPSINSIRRGSTVPPPTTPSTTRSAPVERCTSMPISTSCAMTASTCVSEAFSFMTTTIISLYFRYSLFVIRYLFCVTALLRFSFRFDALNPSHLVHYAFVEPRDDIAVERPAKRVVHFAHVRDHVLLALRLVDRLAKLVLQAAD